jgi:hypothetical protein
MFLKILSNHLISYFWWIPLHEIRLEGPSNRAVIGAFASGKGKY